MPPVAADAANDAPSHDARRASHNSGRLAMCVRQPFTKHYKRRPLDLLRLHHEKIEAWILEQAGVKFDLKAEPGKLTLVG